MKVLYFLLFGFLVGCDSDYGHDSLQNVMKNHLKIGSDHYITTCTHFRNEMDFDGVWCIEVDTEIEIPRAITSQISHRTEAEQYIQELYRRTGQRADEYLLYQIAYVDASRCQDTDVCSVAILAKEGSRKMYIFMHKI